jgi:two-component system, cell cycle sensor histidine kinase and response regulator CckA
MATGNAVYPTTPKVSPTILIVEDDAHVLALFSKDLQEQGYTVLQAVNSQEALRICKQYSGPIHLLLTDLLLPPKKMQLATQLAKQPCMQGLELVRNAMMIRPQIRVILMSGHSDEDLRAFNLSKQGKPFLRKPISLDILLRTVHQVLSRPPAA